MSLFHRKPAPKFVLINRDVCRMTLDEWRTNSECVTLAQKVLRNPEVRMMLDVLRNSNIALQVMDPATPFEVRAFQQAKSEGYSLSLNDFEALGTLQKSTAMPEETFSPETKEL